MRQSILLKILIMLLAMAAIGGAVVWVFIRFRPKLYERQNFNPNSGSGRIEFKGFVSPDDFTPEELRLYNERSIRIRTNDVPQ
jgi:hypothetical protein